MPKPTDRDDGEELQELNGGRKTAQELAEEVLEEEADGEGEEIVIEEGEDDDDDGKDERIGKGRVDERAEGKPGERRDARANETDEQRRERRRREKKEAKARRAEAINRDKTELRFLRNEIDRLHAAQAETRKAVVGNQVTSIDSRIEAIESRIRQADEVIARAVEAQNGDDMVKAQAIRDKLVRNLDRLQIAKQNTIQTHQREQHEAANNGGGGQPAQRPPNPLLVAEFRRFHTRNDWFNPQGTDEDSAVVLAIDNVMTAEGELDPATPEYWDELERRVKKRIPHRFDDVDDDEDDDDDDEQPQRGRNNGQQHRQNGGSKTPARKGGGGPRMPAGGNGGGGNRPGTFYVSADRKQAMIEAGVWDDPKLRQRYIKKYREWDEANAPRDRR